MYVDSLARLAPTLRDTNVFLGFVNICHWLCSVYTFVCHYPMKSPLCITLEDSIVVSKTPAIYYKHKEIKLCKKAEKDKSGYQNVKLNIGGELKYT